MPIVPIVTRPSAVDAITMARGRAGDSIEDFCRACKLDRMHTVIAADPNGLPIRVACGYCSSEHNYRGGPRMRPAIVRQRSPAGASATARAQSRREPGEADSAADRDRFPVSERERTAPPWPSESRQPDFEMLLRRVIREESGVTPVAPAEKWRGGRSS